MRQSLSRLKARMDKRYYSLMAAVTIATISTIGPVWAQGTGGADPSAPLEFLKTARQKAASSNLNTTSATTFGGNIATLVAITAGVVGLVLAAVSGKKLYESVQNENSRENVGASVMGLVIGGLLTIIGIIVGATTNFATGSSG